MNSVAYLPQSKRLLEQVSEVLRYKHYSLKTEQAYLYWTRFYVRWHGRDGQMQHPRSMGAAEVTQFLAIDLPWLTEVQRPTRPRRIPSVLTKSEVASLLGCMDGEMALLAKLLYGTGMRLMEGLRLRVKDVDFDRQVVMLPQTLVLPLREQLARSRALWALTGRQNVQEWPCLLRWKPNTPAAVLSGAITCMNNACNGRSKMQ